MTEPLPKWIQKRYALLWNAFKDRKFSFEEAEKAIKDKAGINVFLSDLKKAGWIDVTLNPMDARKRIYQLKNPAQVIQEMSQ